MKNYSKELQQEIYQKLDEIREKVSDNKGAESFLEYETLIMISDELSDVLLNFEPRPLQSEFGDDYYEEYDEDHDLH